MTSYTLKEVFMYNTHAMNYNILEYILGCYSYKLKRNLFIESQKKKKKLDSAGMEYERINPESQVLTEEKLDEISAGFYLLINPKHALHRRLGLKFHVFCFQKGTSMNECGHFMKVQGMHV
jgi:hypothetical protein